jgi:hypothetical protein
MGGWKSMKHCGNCGAEIPGNNQFRTLCDQCIVEKHVQADKELVAENYQPVRPTTLANPQTTKGINIGWALAAIAFVVFGLGFFSMHAMGLGLILFFIGLYCMSKI